MCICSSGYKLVFNQARIYVSVECLDGKHLLPTTDEVLLTGCCEFVPSDFTHPINYISLDCEVMFIIPRKLVSHVRTRGFISHLVSQIASSTST